MRQLILTTLIAFAPIAFTGCASMGVTTGSTAEKALVAESSINAAVALTTTALESGAITADEAKTVRGLAVNAHDALGLVEAALSAGDGTLAEHRLELAQSVLKSLQTYLNQRGIST